MRHFSPIRPLTPSQVGMLESHYRLLMHWNRVLNLTSIRNIEEAVLRHYCESLFLGSHLPEGAFSILDVGSGGGFPGIPIAALRPDCQLVLAESHQRKAVFLREATRDWPNVRVEARRAEEIRGKFEWIVSRAVRWEPVVALARERIGLLIGEDDALAALTVPGFAWEPLVPLPWGQRRVLLIGSRAV